MISRADIELARSRIAPFVRETPVLRLGISEEWGGADLLLKLECHQVTGSFKPRGVFNRLLSADIPKAGVVAASGGNHGIAVAYAVKLLGTRAEVYVPSLCPQAKRAALRTLGATVVEAGSDYVEALVASEARAEETGALRVHAFDHPDVIAGQGTVALELEAQAPGLETVLVAVGGGGFIAGCAAWYSGSTRIVAVEPEGCPTLNHALAADEPVDVATGGIGADSLGCRRLGDLAFPICRLFVERSLLVAERAIREAQRLLWSEARVIAEPGGAVAMAALTAGTYRPKFGERVCAVVCGANTDLGSILN